jgi:hypothetical protein
MTGYGPSVNCRCFTSQRETIALVVQFERWSATKMQMIVTCWSESSSNRRVTSMESHLRTTIRDRRTMFNPYSLTI